MADLTPSQEATRSRVEGLIGLAAPLLDVVLAIGERISRIAEPTDYEYYPIQSGQQLAELPGAAPIPDRQARLHEDGTIDASAEEIGSDEPA